MSDHPREAGRNLKRIHIRDDIYFDVFYLLAPSKVGLELALVSVIFDAMVDTHFNYRKWALGKLIIWSKNIVKTNDDGTEITLPFPQKPLPNSIVGFARLDFLYTTCDAIDFLKCIGRLLESNVRLKLDIDKNFNWLEFAASVWPLLNVSALIKIHFGLPSDFQSFRRNISPSILCDCSNLRMISFDVRLFIQFPPDDRKRSSDGQAICKWLLTPRADGQPKVLKCWCSKISMDALKTTFLSATTSVSFIIRLGFVPSVGPFELVNSLTREQLTSRRGMNDYDGWWLIERSPIDKNAEQWAKWEKEASKEGTIDWKVLGFLLV